MHVREDWINENSKRHIARRRHLHVVAKDGRSGTLDLRPYLESPAFPPLKDRAEFSQVRNGGYYIEWPCGADLSADNIEARWQECHTANTRQAVAQEGRG